MIQDIINALVPSIITALVSILTYVGVSIKKKIAEKVDNEMKKSLVQTVVKFVEQVYVDIHGKEKFDLALQRAQQLFEEKGIKIGEFELEMLIEEVVNNINSAEVEYVDIEEAK